MLTVTTAATELKLVTVATLRTAMGITDQSDDEALQGFVDRASDVIARHCRRVFAAETVEQTFRLDQWRDDLVLSRYPVSSIASVVENGAMLDAADYEVNGETGLLTRLTGDRPCWWPCGKIVVAYTAGFDLPTDTPGALAQACIQLAKSYAMGIDRDPMVRSESVEALSSASYFAADANHLPPEVRGLLAPFRNFRAR